MRTRTFTLIELMIVIAIIAIVAAIAIPNLMSARKNANEAAAIGSLKAVINAQSLYREGDKDGDNTNQFAPGLAQLANVGVNQEDLIDDVLAGGQKQGYSYTLMTPAAPANRVIWYANADPVIHGTTGDRYFGANMAGLIFFNAGTSITFTTNGASPDPVIGH